MCANRVAILCISTLTNILVHRYLLARYDSLDNPIQQAKRHKTTLQTICRHSLIVSSLRQFNISFTYGFAHIHRHTHTFSSSRSRLRESDCSDCSDCSVSSSPQTPIRHCTHQPMSITVSPNACTQPASPFPQLPQNFSLPARFDPHPPQNLAMAGGAVC